MIEDVREAVAILRQYDYDSERIAHKELVTSVGTAYTDKLISGHYKLL